MQDLVRNIGRISSRKMARMIKQLGLKTQPLTDVERVVIVMKDEEIVIERPQVILMEMKDQEIYQVAGKGEKRKRVKEVEGVEVEEVIEEAPKITEEDIQIVASQANVSLEEARAALEETNGDLAKAILLLKRR